VIGTAAYVSPEQVSAQEIGPPSDIYSLGVVVFEMLTGRVPYDAPSTVLRAAQHVTAPIPSACVLRRDLPATLDEIITQALAKHPADRYPTATALAAALRDIATRQDSPPVRVAEPALRVEVPRLRRRADRPLRVEVPPESPRPRPLKVSVPNPPPRPRRLTRWQLLLILLGLLALALGVAVGFWLEM
jgi:serine/threonine-protein kinase